MKKMILGFPLILCFVAMLLIGGEVDADDGEATYSDEGVISVLLDVGRELPFPGSYDMLIYEGKVDPDSPGTPIITLDKVAAGDENSRRPPTARPQNHTDYIFTTKDSYKSILADMDPGWYTLELVIEQGSGDVTRWIEMPVYGIKITTDADDIDTQVGKTEQVQYKILYEGDYTLDWTSSDEAVVTVDQGGKITGISKGTRNITLMIRGTEYSSTCQVNVFEPLLSLTLDKHAASLKKGDVLQLVATKEPADTGDTLVWTSSDESIATVDQDGKVTTVGYGTAVITVTASPSELKDTCKITVSGSPSPPGPTPPTPTPVNPESIEVIPSEVTLDVGDEYTLTAILYPSGATGTVVWSSSDKDTVSVVDGVITAISPGTATITAKVGNLSATCTVTVRDPMPPVIVEVEIHANDMEVGQEQVVEVIVTPPDVDVHPVSWSSSDEGIATVDSDGRIHALSEGAVTITVTMSDGQKKSVTIKVTPCSYDHDGNWCTWFWWILLIIIIIEAILLMRLKNRYDELEERIEEIYCTGRRV